MLTSHHRLLTRSSALNLIRQLHLSSYEESSFYFPPESVSTIIASSLEETVDDEQIRLDIIKRIGKSTTGAVLFWGPQTKYLIIPPFPISIRANYGQMQIRPLESLLQTDMCLGLVIIRLGEYAIAIYSGEHILHSKKGTGLVHSRHKKGGSSQRRFERHREKQIESFFARICNHTRTLMEPYLNRIDYILYGGEQHTLRSFRLQCGFLSQLNDCTLNRVLTIRNPRKVSFDDMIFEAWMSEVIYWIDT